LYSARIALAPILLIAMSSGLPVAQDGAPSPPSRPAVDSKPATLPASSPSDAAARSFLKAASAKRAPAGEPEIRDITLEFEGESDFQERSEFMGTHTFLAPTRIRTKITNPSGYAEQGFDGSQYWIRRGGEVHSLAGREYEKDRKQIDDSINLTTHLLRLSSVGRLEQEFSTLALDEGPAGDPRVRVTGRIKQFPTCFSGVFAEAEAQLQFDKATFDIVQIRVTEIVAGAVATGKSENIEFSEFRAVRGVRMPHYISSWSKNRERPEFRVQMKSISWNDGLKPADFAPPEK
jgi:hypothetical protein